MALPAGYHPSCYVGTLEVATLHTRMLYSKKMLRKSPIPLINREVRVFQGRLLGRKKKYIHSSPILRIDLEPNYSGHKLILVENGKWYRAKVVI